MKTKIFKLLFCCVALLTFTLQSCSNKEEEIFEESPSARLQALMDKTQATVSYTHLTLPTICSV